MKIILNFVSFWYHFVVGDDWRIAGGVILGLSFIAYTVHIAHVQLWWLLPALVVTMLGLSLWSTTRPR